jgi:hypothetical protein
VLKHFEEAAEGLALQVALF